MSRVEKAKVRPIDSADVAKETQRVEELRGNSAYQRGVSAALSQELVNVRGLFAQGLADLKKVTVKRDVNIPSRESYDRCYQRVTKVAERLATIVPEGEQVRMPVWIPPPEVTAQDTVVVGRPAYDIGAYRESKGLGASGKGLPLKGPGSNVDPDWIGK